MNCFRLRPSIKGFSLIEVLISLFILTIGILGVISIQTLSLKNSIKSVFRGHAANISYEIIDRIRANPGAGYSITVGSSAIPAIAKNCFVEACTATEMKAFDLAEWKCNFLKFQTSDSCVLIMANASTTYTQDQIVLNADASVTCSTTLGEQSCTVSIYWKEDQIYSTNQTDHHYTVTVII